MSLFMCVRHLVRHHKKSDKFKKRKKKPSGKTYINL